MEPWLLVSAALVLLLAPNPLVWPAAVVGTTPLLARTVLTGAPWRRTPFDLPLVLLAAGALLGGYASLNRESTLVRLTGLLAGLFLFVLAREHARGERRLRLLVVGSLVASVLASAVLLVLIAPFLLLEHVPPLAQLVATIDRWQLGDWFVAQDWLLQRYRFRASGVGALADVGLALALATTLGLRSRVGQGLAALAGLFFVVVLIAADNRGSMVAAGMTLGIMATAWRRRLLPLIPLGLLAAVVLVVLSPTDRGLSLRTLAQRFWFWENSIYLAREVPLTGAGLGLESVQLVYRAYFLPTYPPFSHAHNVYLQGLLEYGVFGLAGLIGLGLATLWIAWRVPQTIDRWTEASRLAGLGVALALLTTGLTEIVMLTTLGGALALAGLGLFAGTSGPPAPIPRTTDGENMPAALSPPSSQAGAPRRGWRRSTKSLAMGFGALLVAGVLVSTGLGATLAGRALLSLGAAELNRGSLSETLSQTERAGALERSVSLLRLAGSLAPSDPTIQRDLALALSANGDDRRARAAADRAKALTTASNRQDLLQLGRAYVAVSAWGEAIRAWQDAGASPQLLQLGGRLIRARNLDQAENAYLTAAQLDPGSHGAFDGIVAVARQRELSTDETIERLAPLMETGSPTEYSARLEAASVYREGGQLRQAMMELKQAEGIRSGADLAFEIGLTALRAGLADAAEPVLARAASDEPYDPDHWYWLARAHTRSGHPEEAIGAIKMGLSMLDPSGQFAPPAERLPETAAVRAEQIKRSERAPLLGALSEGLLAAGRPAEAIAAIEEAVDAVPNNAWLRDLRANVVGAAHGAPVNLLANSDFSADGDWVLRVPDLTARPTLENLTDGLPQIANGQAHLAPRPPTSRVLLQEVPTLAAAGARYRVRARVRGEQLGEGAVQLRLVTLNSPTEPVAVASTNSNQWTALEIEATLTTPEPTPAFVVIGLSADASPDAGVWIDDVVMTRIIADPAATSSAAPNPPVSDEARARDERRKADLRSLQGLLQRFYDEHGRYPCPNSNTWQWSTAGRAWIVDEDPLCSPQVSDLLFGTSLDRMPVDPINNAGPFWEPGKYVYGYRGYHGMLCPGKAGQYFVLAARLEDTSDPDGKVKAQDCDGSTLGWPDGVFVLSSELRR